MSAAKLYRGSCLCGEVVFEAGGFDSKCAHCHCRMCRKFHGAAFSTMAAASDVNWLRGAALLQDYTASNGTVRTFCKACGSSVAFRSRGADALELSLSLFDEDPPVRGDAHIFTDFKAGWCEILDELPQHARRRE
ncbi:unnamed protein product, partial [Ectocarpus fasciculatus]